MVIFVSFFEEVNNVYYNLIVVIDVDGMDFGVYCKLYILDGLGY